MKNVQEPHTVSAVPLHFWKYLKMKRIFFKDKVNFHYKCPNPFKLFISWWNAFSPQKPHWFSPASLWIQMNAMGKCAPFPCWDSAVHKLHSHTVHVHHRVNNHTKRATSSLLLFIFLVFQQWNCWSNRRYYVPAKSDWSFRDSFN